MEKFGCLGLLVILLGLGIPISSVGYHPKYSERWGVASKLDLREFCILRRELLPRGGECTRCVPSSQSVVSFGLALKIRYSQPKVPAVECCCGTPYPYRSAD